MTTRYPTLTHGSPDLLTVSVHSSVVQGSGAPERVPFSSKDRRVGTPQESFRTEISRKPSFT